MSNRTKAKARPKARPTRLEILRTLNRLAREVDMFSRDAGNRGARMAYIEEVREGVRDGSLADNPRIVPRHRTYGGIAAWAARSTVGLQVSGYNRIIGASRELV